MSTPSLLLTEAALVLMEPPQQTNETLTINYY